MMGQIQLSTLFLDIFPHLLFFRRPLLSYFYAFFAAIFSWKIQHQVLFSFEPQDNFFWRPNIHPLHLV